MLSLPKQASHERTPGVAIVDSNYRYLAINSVMASFHGRPVEDHLGHYVGEALQKSVQHLLLPVYQKVIADGVPVEGLVVEALATNGVKKCIVNYYPVRIDGDPLWGVQVNAVDITPVAPKLPQSSRECNFSPMQWKVLQLIGEGKSSKEIANLLRIGTSTVGTHRKLIFRKTHLHTTPELVRYARKVIFETSPHEGIVKTF